MSQVRFVVGCVVGVIVASASFGDNIEGLMNAVRYLERAAKQQEKDL